jgi:DNA-binding protein H-NS
MKKIIVICICGISIVVNAVSPEDVHHKNIEAAITQFSVTLTNDIRSMDYDFLAMLREIKDIKSCDIRTNLLFKLTEQLCYIDKDAWKYDNWSSLQWKRVYLMVKAMYSVDDKNIMFKWQRYLSFLQVMKSELVLYEDVKHPDAYRDRWIAEAKEELMEQIRKAGTNKNILIRGTVPLSKARREASAKWSYKKSIEREIARYEKRYFDSLVLMDDYRKLNTKEREQLMEMVKEGLGRYPKWYQKEQDALSDRYRQGVK